MVGLVDASPEVLAPGGSAQPAAGARHAAGSSFAPLREELVLKPGPSLRGGAPSWTLYDPVANRFYRLGWLEFEILCRWHLGSSAEIANRIERETTLRPTPEDVDGFVQFLGGAELLRSSGPEATSRLCSRKAAARTSWYMWLLHHYLFVRIPLVRPDRLLGLLLPRLQWIYSWAFLWVSVAAGLFGLYLALRQWDSFKASLLWFFSLEGVALAGAALLASKMLHELGHGLTAKRLGCRVPTMGLALLVMMPVLYTDTSAAWHLPKRSQRLAIGSAGVITECCLAAYALLLWNFVPDGVFRSILFVWATTTWVLTVLINMSPFMRFDGYYLFSDLIDVPNLQDRSFALARHWLRETLFGFGEPPPETWSPEMRRVLIIYAFATWTYRLVLFLGIAFIVYHMFFKVLGILLFAVELWWFIARPIVREVAAWARWGRARKLNTRSLVTLGLLGLLVIALVVPWRTSIHAPALMAAEARVRLFSQVPGRVAMVLARSGDPVREGDPVIVFASPDIEYKRAQAERRVTSIEAQIQAASQEPTLRSRAQVLARQLQGAQAELAAARVEEARLTIRAPLSGTLVDMAEPLGIGEWVKPGELLGIVADMSGSRIDAYVGEGDLERIAPGTQAVFVPTDVAAGRVEAEITGIDRTAVRVLPDPELASVNGGAIAARQGPDDTLIPENPVYRVTLRPLEQVDLRHTSTGNAILDGKPSSVAGKAWRKIASVIIRESGF
ncbi:HlyD family efflux transporter periplasmic adaptor subunit [Chelatococcus sp. GCM10030263]|uniref:HlyD family efflux transporter periplasmic adaptor subunit n=1 Tax=Chelatococcus sp. GCM10030263 TaxID=3273387 RepID=UPI0036118DDC